MELLYRSVVPSGCVHRLAWSGGNFLALSVSVQSKTVVAEAYKRAQFHQLLVFDPNRPWEFHTVSENKAAVVSQLEWSLDGSRLLALSEDSIIRIWRIHGQCVNSWVCSQKQEPDRHPSSSSSSSSFSSSLSPAMASRPSSVVHAAWLHFRPMVTIHHAKQEWSQAMEVQPFSPRLRMLLGSSFVSVSSNGRVRVTSTSVPYGSQATAELTLPGESTITSASTFVTQTGSVLCGVACEEGQLKVFSITASLCWGNDFTISSSLVTELHQSSPSDTVTGLLMLPHSDGCVVHVCYNKTQLYQWSVKDITRSGSYQSRREGVYSSSQPVASLAGSALCLGSHDPSLATESKMSELLDLGVEDSQVELKWPVELLVTVSEDGELAVFNRDAYKVLLKYQCSEDADLSEPAAKRARNASRAGYVVCLSPSASCVAIARGDTISMYNTGGLILGVKDASTPEVPRLSRLLSVAAVGSLSPWDLILTACRMEPKQGAGFVEKVLAHFSEDFNKNSSSLKPMLMRHYFTTCFLLHSCHDDGLLPALRYRDVARLHATHSLLTLALPTCQKEGSPPLLDMVKDMCSDGSEESLEEVAGSLDGKEFAASPVVGVASELEGHCHWVVELAIRAVSSLATDNTAILPDSSSLELLRSTLVLVYIWIKVKPQAVRSVTEGALCLLFKALTAHLQSSSSSSSSLPEELLSEISSNVPSDKHPNLLTLTKAAHLQGFLSGLMGAKLPEDYQQSVYPRLRPHVQSKYISLDPYSPLTLVVPEGLSPPWRDCFVEGQKDLIHGGCLMKTVVQNSKLKQCSRCRGWSVSSSTLQAGSGGGGDGSSSSGGGGGGGTKPSPWAHPVQQWRKAWSSSCLCGAPWTLRDYKRT